MKLIPAAPLLLAVVNRESAATAVVILRRGAAFQQAEERDMVLTMRALLAHHGGYKLADQSGNYGGTLS
ncbi:MAG: hypothetical protein WA792_12395 [Pseudolabrys sp.]|jgi:hypothetical protein